MVSASQTLVIHSYVQMNTMYLVPFVV